MASGRRTVAAYTASLGAGTGVYAVELGRVDASALPEKSLTPPSRRRRHPPLGFASTGDTVVIAWRETAPATSGRIAWTESPDAESPFSTPRALAAEFGSDPRGRGAPPTLMAIEGRVTTRQPPWQRDFGVWQRRSSEPTGWAKLGPSIAARPSTFTVVGAGDSRALVASTDGSRELTFTRTRADAPSETTTVAGHPAGPASVWLSRAPDAVIAGWTEWSPGATNVAVRVTRSTDGGASWEPPSTLYAGTHGLHPLASFARDGSTVVAVWRIPAPEAERIALAVSTDAGSSFSHPLEIDRGQPETRRSRPRVAVSGERILATWQAQEASVATIRATVLTDFGSRPSIADEPIATAAPGRSVRNPQPWLSSDGGGGVLWESAASAHSGPLPSTAQGPQRVSLHARPLRR